MMVGRSKYLIWIHLISLAIGIASTSWTFAAAREHTDPAIPLPTEEKIEAAIKALSSDSWKEREAAQDRLVNCGDDAIPRLQHLVNTTTDEETRTRAINALRKIDENAAFTPSLITLHVKDSKPQDVFNLIAKQARSEFATYPVDIFQQANAKGLRITMNVDHANFWVALKEACRQTGVHPGYMMTDRLMTFRDGVSKNIPWNDQSATSGPFLVVPVPVTRSEKRPKEKRTDNLLFYVFAEPKLKMFEATDVHVEEAVDEKGNSLVVERQGVSSSPLQGRWIWGCGAEIKNLENAGKTLTRFKGTITAQIQSKSVILDLPDILSAKKREKTVAGGRILINQVTRNDDEYAVVMRIYRDQRKDEVWSNMYASMSNEEVLLIDKNGDALQRLPHEDRNDGDGQYRTFVLHFDRNTWHGNVGEPDHLIWEIPLKLREEKIPFEFKNLPLP